MADKRSVNSSPWGVLAHYGCLQLIQYSCFIDYAKAVVGMPMFDLWKVRTDSVMVFYKNVSQFELSVPVVKYSNAITTKPNHNYDCLNFEGEVE